MVVSQVAEVLLLFRFIVPASHCREQGSHRLYRTHALWPSTIHQNLSPVSPEHYTNNHDSFLYQTVIERGGRGREHRYHDTIYSTSHTHTLNHAHYHMLPHTLPHTQPRTMLHSTTQHYPFTSALLLFHPLPHQTPGAPSHLTLHLHFHPYEPIG